MSEMYPVKEYVFSALFLFTFLQFGFFLIVFTRKVMARIERKIKEDGGMRPAQWDGTGGRTAIYSIAVLMSMEFAQKADSPLFEYSLVRRYARAEDRRLAIWLHVSSAVFLLWDSPGVLWGYIDQDMELSDARYPSHPQPNPYPRSSTLLIFVFVRMNGKNAH